jgi:hypothetical protein
MMLIIFLFYYNSSSLNISSLLGIYLGMGWAMVYSAMLLMDYLS